MHPRVLVVDDDPDILDAICDILGSEGYDVVRAKHGVEALERTRSLAGIPIIVISAEGNPARAASVHARRYLAKPFDIDVLLSQVADVADHPDSPGAGAASP